jgi:hypothetical protein
MTAAGSDIRTSREPIWACLFDLFQELEPTQNVIRIRYAALYSRLPHGDPENRYGSGFPRCFLLKSTSCRYAHTRFDGNLSLLSKVTLGPRVIRDATGGGV